MAKKVLVVGSGGREHALVWKLSKSSEVDRIFCAPGNAGISGLAQCIDIKPEDVSSLLNFAINNKIDLTVVGPESPLCLGIVDEFSRAGLRIFGPDKKGAMLEGSKIFCKELLRKYRIRTASFSVFDNYDQALSHVEKAGYPLVIKADGLCAGKGVVIAKYLSEARLALNSMMNEKIFGDAGKRVIIEDFIRGEEVSFMAITDGETILPLATSQDHKAVFDNDVGPNTGGMGAYSPAPIVNESLYSDILENIIKPTVYALKNEGINYKGVLYAGLMISDDNKPMVLEYNCRFGDPEAQAILMRLDGDFYKLLEDTVDGKLAQQKIEWKDKAALCVVMASRGYPGDYEKNIPISGLGEINLSDELMIFHAGTRMENNEILTSGGRVLGVTALGDDIKKAMERAYKVVSNIHFEGCHFRRDIGKKAFKWIRNNE